MPGVYIIIRCYVVVVVASSWVSSTSPSPRKLEASIGWVHRLVYSGEAGWVGWAVKKVVCFMRGGLAFRTFISFSSSNHSLSQLLPPFT